MRAPAARKTSLEETLPPVRDFGASVWFAVKVTALERDLCGRLAAIGKCQAGRASRSVLLIVGRPPARLNRMIAMGRGSILNDLIPVAGGRGLLPGSPVTCPEMSLEAVLRLAPEAIVGMAVWRRRQA